MNSCFCATLGGTSRRRVTAIAFYESLRIRSNGCLDQSEIAFKNLEPTCDTHLVWVAENLLCSHIELGASLCGSAERSAPFEITRRI